MDEVYRHVKARILGAALNEGDFLTEAQVAGELGLSRTPVREAFQRLEHEGLLRRVPNRGAFVPPITWREVEEVMEARRLLELHAAMHVIAAGIDLGGPLRELLEEQMGHADAADIEAFMDSDRRFHATIMRAAGNRVIADVYDGLRDKQTRMGVRALSGSAQRAQQVVSEHAAIAEAIVAGDDDGLTSALDAHLERTLSALRAEH